MTNDELLNDEIMTNNQLGNWELGIRNYFIILVSLFVILFSTAVFAQTTFDPLAIGVGARALGMGKAYVAVAEDGETIFTNPAGLGEIDNFKFTSMSGFVLEDVNYTVLGGVYPLGEKTAIGIGYVSSTVPGIEMRDTTGALQKKSDFINSVFLASFGRKLTDKISLGINFKYFIQDGSELNEGDGTGINLDIGYLQKGLGWFSLGAVAQNIWNSGKINYKSGEKEDFPLILKIGVRLGMLGEKFESAILSPVELNLVADANFNLKESRPVTTHLGAELSPAAFLTFRAGIDQDPKPGGLQSIFTSGVSLKYAGMGFHYAYHPYTEASENVTHYFSISFDERGWPPEVLPDVFLAMNKL
jgi:hypothetical protein